MTRFYISHPPAPRKHEFGIHDNDYADAEWHEHLEDQA